MNALEVLGEWLKSQGIEHVEYCEIIANWCDYSPTLHVNVRYVVQPPQAGMLQELVTEWKRFELKEIA